MSRAAYHREYYAQNAEKRRAQRRGVKRLFTADEDDYILDHKDELGAKAIGEKLDRPASSIRARYRKLTESQKTYRRPVKLTETGKLIAAWPLVA